MQTLKEFVEANPRLVTRKESKNYPGLFVLKYAKKVFYDALWNTSPHLLECRGQVIDEDYNTVIRPFTKIFNYGENGAGSKWKDTDYVLVTKKVNGFMAAVTKHNGKIIISTTGSLDSDFVGYARDYLGAIEPSMCNEGVTYLFEICHTIDPHIIQEKFGAHFLAIVEHSTGIHHYKFDDTGLMFHAIENFAPLGIHVEDEEAVWSFGKLKEHLKTVNHEGYVIVHFETNETLKIKSQYYLFQKFLARVGTKKLIDGIRTGTIKQRIDEEYYDILQKVVDYGVDDFSELEEQNRLDVLRIWIGEQYAN